MKIGKRVKIRDVQNVEFEGTVVRRGRKYVYVAVEWTGFTDAPPYCNGCGHFHIIDSACPEGDCGSFLCCNGLSDDDN